MDTVFLYALAFVLIVVSLIKSKKKTFQALKKALKAVENIMPQFLVVILLVAMVLSVFDSETISRYLGDQSGFPGTAAAAVVGAVTLIPGFIAFPAAAELLKNGAGVAQVAAFITSLMMVGVVTLPMEIKVFGRQASILRNILSFIFVFAAACFVAGVVRL